MCAVLLAASAPSSRHVVAASPPRAVLVDQRARGSQGDGASARLHQASEACHGPRHRSGAGSNGTGIIGDEFTPLTTSLGDVEAKRTSTNPAFAALLVKFFHDAGLKRGDVVAVGASGSFPALLLATLSTSRVLGLEPIVIYSIGASMYATPTSLEFTFVDMLSGLRAEGPHAVRSRGSIGRRRPRPGRGRPVRRHRGRASG